MSDVKNEVLTEPQKMQMEIEELKLKFGKLNKDVKKLETSKTSQGSDLEQIHVEFEQTNKSIDEILEKLNKLSEQYCENTTEMHEKNNISKSIKDCFTGSLKKIAVVTLSLVYTVADKTVEKTSKFREGFEDIAAEAQYVNKQRNCPPVENN